MTEAKHTPGPWRWEEGSWGYSTLFNPRTNQEVLTTGGQNDGDRPITWMGEDMTDADRDLIAAAPELLAFIEEIVGDLEGLSHEQKALDLIAKVKGEAE